MVGAQVYLVPQEPLHGGLLNRLQKLAEKLRYNIFIATLDQSNLRLPSSAVQEQSRKIL